MPLPKKVKRWILTRYYYFWLEYHKAMVRSTVGENAAWEYHFDQVGKYDKKLEELVKEG